MKSLDIKNFIYFMTVFLLFISCKKGKIEKKPEKVKPDIELKSAAVYPDGGINLVGSMNKLPENLTEYGFIVSKDSLFKKSNTFHQINLTPKIGEFNVDVNFGLEKDSIYYCAAYTIATPNTLKTSNVKSVKSKGNKIIIDKWVMVSNQVPFSEYDHIGTFTINNISYVIASSKDFMDVKKYVWKFNSVDYTWQKMEIPFKFDAAQLIATLSKVYLYINTDLNNFWEYDPSSNLWTNKANYMAGVRNFGSMFSANGDVYLGMGRLGIMSGNYTPDNSIYKYAVSSNTWQKVTDYPTESVNRERVRPNIWVVNNKMYIGAGAINSGQSQFHSYNLDTDTWTKLKDVPDVRSDAVSFTFGNYIFLAAGNKFNGGSQLDISKYEINTNTWTLLPDLIGNPQVSPRVERGYAFINNGKVFFGGGNSSSDRYELYAADANGL